MRRGRREVRGDGVHVGRGGQASLDRGGLGGAGRLGEREHDRVDPGLHHDPRQRLHGSEQRKRQAAGLRQRVAFAGADDADRGHAELRPSDQGQRELPRGGDRCRRPALGAGAVRCAAAGASCRRRGCARGPASPGPARRTSAEARSVTSRHQAVEAAAATNSPGRSSRIESTQPGAMQVRGPGHEPGHQGGQEHRPRRLAAPERPGDEGGQQHGDHLGDRHHWPDGGEPRDSSAHAGSHRFPPDICVRRIPQRTRRSVQSTPAGRGLSMAALTHRRPSRGAQSRRAPAGRPRLRRARAGVGGVRGSAAAAAPRGGRERGSWWSTARPSTATAALVVPVAPRRRAARCSRWPFPTTRPSTRRSACSTGAATAPSGCSAPTRTAAHCCWSDCTRPTSPRSTTLEACEVVAGLLRAAARARPRRSCAR